MNVLVTGGYGFIGSFVAERFFKEGHAIFILDDLSAGKKENVTFKHRSFIGDVADERSERFFRTHSFDIVIHCAAQTSVQRSVEDPIQDTSTNVLGLVNMLNLSKKYGIQSFVFCSSAAVYGNSSQLPLTEDQPLDPLSPYGINKRNGELYCEKWTELYGVPSLILRFSNVYGPRQHISTESGIVSVLTNAFLKQQDITVYGNGEQTRDFIYAGDVAEAVYRGVISGLSGVYNVSGNEQTSINALILAIADGKQTPPVSYEEAKEGDILHSQLDNQKLKKELDWVPKYTLQEGLQKTMDYYREAPVPAPAEAKEKEKTAVPWRNPWIKLAENAVLFFIFYLLSLAAVPVVEAVDFWMIYVLLAALLFGKTAAIVASFLAISIHVAEAVESGRAAMSLVVDNELVAIFTIYLLIGLIVSYVVDRRQIELLFTKDELASLQEQHAFLTTVYEDTLDIKNELQQQILRSENGIGQIYEATRSLDSLEPEALFAGSIDVLEKTLKTKYFAFYSITPNGFARLVAKSNHASFSPGASLKIEDDAVMNAAVRQQQLQFNHAVAPGAPIFAAPIVQQGKTVAMIVCYDVSFSRLTLSFRNMVDVVTRLIGSALERSSSYLQEINHERYVEETTALKPAYFTRVLQQKQQAAESLQLPYTLLRVEEDASEKQVLHKIGNALRTTDYFGFTEDGNLHIILSNTKPSEASLVVERLLRKDIRSHVTEEVMPYAN